MVLVCKGKNGGGGEEEEEEEKKRRTEEELQLRTTQPHSE